MDDNSGLYLDMLFLALAGSAITGWACFWSISVNHSARLLSRWSRANSRPIAAAIICLYLLATILLPLNNYGWFAGRWLSLILAGILPLCVAAALYSEELDE